MYYTDRSRILTYQSCPRRRYWAYEHAGRGIAKKEASLPLALGRAVHEGCAEVLRGHDIETAVGAALASFSSDNPEGPEFGEYSWFLREQESLVEALVRAFDVKVAPKLRGTVVEVEQEYVVPLDTGISFMSRADALLRTDSGLTVLSLKTKAKVDSRDYEIASHDMQSMSEIWAIEQATGRTVDSVQMLWMVKGTRRNERQQSFLVHPWMRDDGLGRVEWAYDYYYSCEEPHQIARGKFCQGGQRHTLGKGWSQVNIWEIMPIKSWIRVLEDDLRDPLSQLFVWPPEIYRNKQEIDDWLEQVRAQENTVLVCSEGLSVLNQAFPQHTERCDFPTSCQFIPICFRGVDPLNSGLYKWREPNHPAETFTEDA
jgi:hypothetical protein